MPQSDVPHQVANLIVNELRNGNVPQVAYVDTKRAAAYLSLSGETLERLRVSGGGPKFVKLAKAVRYKLEDLEAWADSHRICSTSEGGAA